MTGRRESALRALIDDAEIHLWGVWNDLRNPDIRPHERAAALRSQAAIKAEFVEKTAALFAPEEPADGR